MLKTCFKCGEPKPIDEFYRHPEMADGHLGKCKECTKRDVQKHYVATIDARKDYEYRRSRTEARRRRALEQQRIYRRTYPERNRARAVLGYYVRSGKIQRQPCIVCGDPKSEGHHHDYSKPLDVIWACLKHHREIEGRVALGRRQEEP